jgi:hypothetical protein
LDKKEWYSETETTGMIFRTLLRRLFDALWSSRRTTIHHVVASPDTLPQSTTEAPPKEKGSQPRLSAAEKELLLKKLKAQSSKLRR